MGEKLSLDERIKRDQRNAQAAKDLADNELKEFSVITEKPDITRGHSHSHLIYLDRKDKELSALQAVSKNSFHAMVEVDVVTEDKHGKKYLKSNQLWYANEHSAHNVVLQGPNGRISILSWTHPGFQLALAGKLGEEENVGAHGYTLKSITPLARAKFSRVLPEISGLYEPGGSVRPEKIAEPSKGLKAIKLDMTFDQVQAFISKMDGMMMVTGAPGSGKTTVAFQRVRFLYDQQRERLKEVTEVEYSSELTRIFLANENLITYSRKLLVDDLQIPERVVSLVPDFIRQYLSDRWLFKHDARLRPRIISHLEQRAREAFFGLCKAEDLISCWKQYENQIAERLSKASDSEWLVLLGERGEEIERAAEELAIALMSAVEQPQGLNPIRSRFRMDGVFRSVRREYEDLRVMLNVPERELFDKAFQQWLYWVYDPLYALTAYFSERLYEGQLRIRRGTAARIREDEVIQEIQSDWDKRQYGPEEEPWLAWLLRFVLPEETDPRERFREMPWALPIIEAGLGKKWTHLVIDEAQDLSVPEASLLGSFVHPDGALTVSADFRQVVSPVHGMTDWEAFKIGSSLRDINVYQIYPFYKNMRQSRQITRFLQSFYQSAFGELAPFEASDRFDDLKPQLMIGRATTFPRLIRQMLSALRRSDKVKTIALIQINEDEEAMNRLRGALEREGVKLAPIWEPEDDKGGLITTSVERIKGLEFDACLVFGLDDIERVSLEFTTNRAYVAMSRPTRRLAIFCQEFPKLLQRVDHNLFDVRRLRA